MGIFEIFFDLSYLILVISFGLILLVENNKNAKIFGLMAVVLGLGDSFHLLPRIISYLSPKGFEGNYIFLSYGKMVTSITMTFFYLLYYFYYRRVSGDFDKKKAYLIYILATLRIVISLLPQNKWASGNESYAFAIYRNIPFAIMGLLLIIFSYKKRSLPYLKNMWLLISLSFIFYIPVVLFADKYPPVGALMMPKTLAYLFIVISGLKIFIASFDREKFLSLSFTSLILGLGFGAFYREFTKFYNYTGQTHLSKLHPHILVLGFVFSIILYLISKDYSLDRIRKLGKNFSLYLTGLFITLIAMISIGLWQVINNPNKTMYLKAFEGLAGIGHIILAIAMVKIILFIIKNEREKIENGSL
ncbi:MAG: DUF2871 domain-containing protein [Peptoniphilaceae bacterium]|nr:DUF2871 domain-containing protein [Peptoniphilaceae bacterium]MDY6018529.1 DUF2871 domain-containing protein [Anaerococcus sp.]